MILEWIETKLYRLEHGSKSTQTSLITNYKFNIKLLQILQTKNWQFTYTIKHTGRYQTVI